MRSNHQIFLSLFPSDFIPIFSCHPYMAYVYESVGWQIRLSPLFHFDCFLLLLFGISSPIFAPNAPLDGACTICCSTSKIHFLSLSLCLLIHFFRVCVTHSKCQESSNTIQIRRLLVIYKLFGVLYASQRQQSFPLVFCVGVGWVNKQTIYSV